jgi:hypothetical protein
VAIVQVRGAAGSEKGMRRQRAFPATLRNGCCVFCCLFLRSINCRNKQELSRSRDNVLMRSSEPIVEDLVQSMGKQKTAEKHYLVVFIFWDSRQGGG